MRTLRAGRVACIMVSLMRILIVSPRQCWPPTSGAKLREYHLARSLSRRAEVSRIYFRDPDSGMPDPSELPFLQDSVAVPRPHTYTPVKILRGLAGRWPLTVLNYTSRQMKASLERMLSKQRFDLVQFEGIHMAAYAPLLERRDRTQPVVYDWHNIESEAMLRYAVSVQSRLRAIYARETARRVASAEVWALRTASGHLVCSEREREALQRLAPEARVAVIANGVDTHFFDASVTAGIERRRVLFVGQMSYHANIEAAVWFARRCWPGIHRRLPALRLTIVGADPAPAVTALASEPGVEVTGTIADVRPFYREAAAAVVPLRAGGGTRLKILEAMAAGVPVVSSTLGAEGLRLTPGGDFLLADCEEDWLTALEALVSRDPLRSCLVEAGRRLVEREYDWEIIGDGLFQTYSRWLADKR